MKIRYLSASLLLFLTPCASHAWTLQELLGKAGEAINGTDTSTIQSLGDMAEGLFAKKNLEVKDLAGTWRVSGPAVSFQSDNFLQKAGGTAAATVIENKLSPYYKKYGLTGATLTIEEDGQFTLQMKKLKLSGTVTKQEAKKGQPTQGGNFFFTFNKFGVTSLGSVNTYVSKSAGGLDIMFDATKLQAIMTSIASFTKSKMANTATKLLNQYDGICVGFDLTPAK